MPEERIVLPRIALAIAICACLAASANAYFNIEKLDATDGRGRLMILLNIGSTLVCIGLLIWAVCLWTNAARELRRRINVDRQEAITRLSDLTVKIDQRLVEMQDTLATRLTSHEKWAAGENGTMQRIVIDRIEQWAQNWENLNSRMATIEGKAE